MYDGYEDCTGVDWLINTMNEIDKDAGASVADANVTVFDCLARRSYGED